jgi:multimeric flavodoxin WrbA
MKKIFVLNGSRRKKGSTTKFIEHIIGKLSRNEFEVEYAFPQDYKINPCTGCQTCFTTTHCVSNDELDLLHEKILSADLLVVASPVYLHYMTADLKLILDKSSWWAHTLRLQGKPVVILSTCSSNGHNTVIEPLSKIMNLMGGNVIATSNAALIPHQIDNEEWLSDVSNQIANRISKYANLPPQSNKFLEDVFSINKLVMLQQEEVSKSYNVEAGEAKFWRESGMFDFDTFSDYLAAKNEKRIRDYEDSLPTTK